MGDESWHCSLEILPTLFFLFFFSSFLPFPFLGCPRYQIATILIRQHINLDYITITILSSSDQGKSKITKKKKRNCLIGYILYFFFSLPQPIVRVDQARGWFLDFAQVVLPVTTIPCPINGWSVPARHWFVETDKNLFSSSNNNRQACRSSVPLSGLIGR